MKIGQLFGIDEVKFFNAINNHQKGGQFQAYLQTEVEQIKMLYEKLLAEKDERILLLTAKKK
jgi:hypothetical protein